MKKYLLTIMALLLMTATAVIFTGCKKNEPVQPKETMTITWTEDDLESIALSEPGGTYTAKGVMLTVIEGTADGTQWQSGERFGAYFNGDRENEPSFSFTTTNGTGKFCKIMMGTGMFRNYDASWKMENEGAVWTGYSEKVGFGPQFYEVEEITFYIEK